MPWPSWRRLGSYAVVVVVNGEGTYLDENGYEADLGPGSLIKLTPELGHRYSPGTDGWVQTYVVFEGPLFELWQQHGIFHTDPPVTTIESPQDWPAQFYQAVHGADDPSRSTKEGLLRLGRWQAVLSRLIANAQLSPAPPDAQAPRWLSQAKQRLAEHLNKPVDWDSLANELGVSYTTFRRAFTPTFGVSPGRYRSGQVIDQARQWMRDTTMNDKQIAVRLGFTDAQHFSRRFKQLVGRTPSQFRASLH